MNMMLGRFRGVYIYLSSGTHIHTCARVSGLASVSICTHMDKHVHTIKVCVRGQSVFVSTNICLDMCI